MEKNCHISMRGDPFKKKFGTRKSSTLRWKKINFFLYTYTVTETICSNFFMKFGARSIKEKDEIIKTHFLGYARYYWERAEILGKHILS